MATGFDTLQHAGSVQGLFLSSGIIKGSVTTQDKIIDTVEIIRDRYEYWGYIHLKIMPGVLFGLQPGRADTPGEPTADRPIA